MKIALIIVLLLAANVLWFNMLAALRRRGHPVSYVNFLSDLKGYHLLIVETDGSHDRHKHTFALIALYLLIAITLLSIIFL